MANDRKILLVDDSEDNHILVKTFLKDFPVTIDLANDGKEALNQFKHHKYKLILMDVVMPIMDGITTTKMIRDIEKKHGHSPSQIFSLTAHSNQEQVESGKAAGCNGHIEKPFKKQDLIDLVKRAIGDD